MWNVILQHGSILCGSFHKRIIDYLNLPFDKLNEIQIEIENTTSEIETVLGKKVDYDKLVQSIKAGFENHFSIKFDKVAVEEMIGNIN